MTTRKAAFRLGCLLYVLATLASLAHAADPGTLLPDNTEASSQKLGSILLYPLYTSSSSSPSQENTKVDITNSSTVSNALVHLFFVPNTGGVADAYICLTPSQTATFLASDVDPGVRGYLIGVAVDSSGFPMKFNALAGQAHVKLSTGYSGNINALAVSAITLPMFSGPSATLNFDSSAYNRLPRALALDQIVSPLDGNASFLVISRIGGSFVAPISTPAIGAFSGNLYNDQGSPFPFSGNGTGVQFQAQLSNSFPSTSPVFNQVIPAGHTGWLYLATNSNAALIGVLLNFNINAATQTSAFNNGRPLRILTLASSVSLVIPVLAPVC